MKYQVTWYGPESGWLSDTQEFGMVEAASASEACDLVALREIPHDQPLSRLSTQTQRENFRAYLSARPA